MKVTSVNTYTQREIYKSIEKKARKYFGISAQDAIKKCRDGTWENDTPEQWLNWLDIKRFVFILKL